MMATFSPPPRNPLLTSAGHRPFWTMTPLPGCPGTQKRERHARWVGKAACPCFPPCAQYGLDRDHSIQTRVMKTEMLAWMVLSTRLAHHRNNTKSLHIPIQCTPFAWGERMCTLGVGGPSILLLLTSQNTTDEQEGGLYINMQNTAHVQQHSYKWGGTRFFKYLHIRQLHGRKAALIGLVQTYPII